MAKCLYYDLSVETGPTMLQIPVIPLCLILMFPRLTQSLHPAQTTPWASYQIHKIMGCTCAGNTRNISPTPDMHHGTCITHLLWCMSGSLTSGFLWRRWWGKRSRHSRRMRNLQFHVSGKRPTAAHVVCTWWLINGTPSTFTRSMA